MSKHNRMFKLHLVYHNIHCYDTAQSMNEALEYSLHIFKHSAWNVKHLSTIETAFICEVSHFYIFKVSWSFLKHKFWTFTSKQTTTLVVWFLIWRFASKENQFPRQGSWHEYFSQFRHEKDCASVERALAAQQSDIRTWVTLQLKQKQILYWSQQNVWAFRNFPWEREKERKIERDRGRSEKYGLKWARKRRIFSSESSCLILSIKFKAQSEPNEAIGCDAAVCVCVVWD